MKAHWGQGKRTQDFIQKLIITGKGQVLTLLLWYERFSSVQSLSCVHLFVTPCIAARQASLSITNSQSSPKLMCIELVMPSSHLILCRPLLLLPPIPPSIRVFSNESTLRMRWPKYWSFSFSISPSNEHPGLISFRMNWLDPFAVQGTLKSLLQHHSSKASILRLSVSFTVQLSHPYVTPRKTIALTRQTFVGKVMSLLFNMLSRLVITFLPRSKHLLISWLQSPSAVISEPPKNSIVDFKEQLRSNQSILKEINPEYSLEGLMLKLKLQYFGQLMWRATHWKRFWCWERLGQEVKGETEDEMVGWHHQLNGHEFQQTLGDSEGEGSLGCCSPWHHKKSDTI